MPQSTPPRTSHTIAFFVCASLPRRSRTAAALLLTVLAMLLPACASDPQPNIDAARQAYQARDYRVTYREATQALSTASGPVRQEAAWMAGLAAYHLGEQGQAERYLREAAGSPEHKLAGDAYAMLGLLLSEQGRYSQAADALHAAAQRLDGPDQANAYLYAALAEQRLGRWPQARTSLILARSANRDPAFRKRVEQQLDVTGFTVQVGAYGSRANAESAAAELAREAAPHKLGHPWIIEATANDGRTLHLVQLGKFHTHQSALQAREKLNRANSIVVPLAENQ